MSTDLRTWSILSFGAGSFELRRSVKRLMRQAKPFGLFTNYFAFDDKKLAQDYPFFWQEHASFIQSNKRGFGYWIWKPFLILKCLEELKEGEGLLYLDGGCHLNINDASILKLKNYFQTAEKTGMLVTQLYDGQFGFESLTEKSWTKKELLDLLEVSERNRSSGQFQSGIIFVINNSENRKLIASWFELSKKNNYGLLTGKSLVEQNYSTFVEHRFDQSIFSALAKNKGIAGFRDETFWDSSWQTEGHDFPIWAIRNTTGIDPYKIHWWDIPDRTVRILRKFKSNLPLIKPR